LVSTEYWCAQNPVEECPSAVVVFVTGFSCGTHRGRTIYRSRRRLDRAKQQYHGCSAVNYWKGNPRPIAEFRRLFDYPKSSQPLDPREYEVGIPSVVYQQIPYEFELASVLGRGSFQIAVNVSAVNPETRAWEMVGNVTVS
jgi:hypothetical protein